MKKISDWLLIVFVLVGCTTKPLKQQLYFNGTVYTVDSAFTVGNSMVVDSGKIVFVGDEKEARKKFSFSTETDLKGKFVYPGFIDPHSHFYGYGVSLSTVNLIGTTDWDQIIKKVKMFSVSHPNGWILGRGWDQNDWKEKYFPTNEKLNALFPDRPVFLKRIDGHAAVANNKALELAGIQSNSKVNGGEILLVNGKLSGVLIDNAMDLVEKIIPDQTDTEINLALQQAQQKCFEVGLTTVTDAGLEKNIIDHIDSLQQKSQLQIKVYAMLADNDENRNYYFTHGVYQTNLLHVCSFKYYADGALGSRGACLLKPYEDDPENYGLMLHPLQYYFDQAALCLQYGFQMNTHCIGDSANRFMLHVYAKTLAGPNDHRWRVEHCQVINENDFHFFHDYNIIPSIQPCFATSDMYWAETRIGTNRMAGAYAWKKLQDEAGLVANGSDFPIENINPLYGFYAAVSRQDQKQFPKNGFQITDALTRQDALRGMTIWAAYSCFEDQLKGSLETGKSADFVILDADLMTSATNDLYKIKVIETFVDGNVVYVAN